MIPIASVKQFRSGEPRLGAQRMNELADPINQLLMEANRRRDEFPGVTSYMFPIIVTDTEAIGLYTARRIEHAQRAIDPSVDLTEDILGQEIEDVLAVYPADVAAGSNTLDFSSDPALFWAELIPRPSSDGRRVVSIVAGAGGGADNTITVKITSNASGGGKYNGRSVTGASTAVASGNLSMPEGMTVAGSDDCLIINYAENGLSTHVLTTSSFHTGIKLGISGGLTVVAINIDALGAGVSQYQVLQMTTSTARGWDWVRAH